MAGEPSITIIGNLTADPELRFTPNGAAVANFTVASTPRTFDRQANDYRDGTTLFMRCSAWRNLAEHLAESLHRGDRVIVSGVLQAREWTDKDSGEQRSSTELQVDEVGPSLRYATAQVTKAQGGNQGQQGGNQGGGWGQPQSQQGNGNQGQPAQQNGGDPWGGGGQQQDNQGQQADPWGDQGGQQSAPDPWA